MKSAISVVTFPASRLADQVRDPAFTGLIQDGYRPIICLPFEPREGAPPELIVVSARVPTLTEGRTTPLLLGVLIALQVASLLVSLLR